MNTKSRRKTKKRNKLSKKLMMGLVNFALIILLLISLFICMYDYSSTMQECSESAFSYARAAAKFVDGDRVQQYVMPAGKDKNGKAVYQVYQTDEYYDNVMAYLSAIQSQVDVMKYYYIFIPGKDCFIYVWDADSAAGASHIGDTEPMTKDDKEIIDSFYQNSFEERLTTYRDKDYGYVASAYYPIYNSAGEVVAAAGVDLSMDGISRSIFLRLLTMIVAVIIMTVIAVTVYYYQIKRTLLNPIRNLNTATKKLVENLDSNEQLVLDIDTNDELEELAQSFSKMNGDLSEYINRLSAVTAEKERIGAELDIAAQIQESMLPNVFPPFPDRKEFDLYASMDPAKEVGGDFYDFFMVDDDHIALVIADVSGKGVPAALFMAITKTLIKSRTMFGDSPEEVLNIINHQICENNRMQYFVTVWMAVIEISTGKGIAVNAGHEHPVLRRAGGQYRLVQYRHSPVVAAIDGIRYQAHPFELSPGDSLFVYTDGVVEAKNAGNELFGTGRMLAALNRNPDAPPEESLKTLRKEIDAFVCGAPQFDDITMLGFRYMGGSDSKNF